MHAFLVRYHDNNPSGPRILSLSLAQWSVSQSVSQALREPDQPTPPLLLPASSTTAQTDRPETE